ncbi:RtcB family protein, partial [bacterium]|nr:RtcB family protein [bacterium]
MVRLQDIHRVNEFEWEIPRTYRADMRVAVHLFVTRQLLEHSLSDQSLEQAINATTLPGVMAPVVVMPDMHQGYGFPIGGVAATSLADGVISPGAIGYDINCGVRLLSSQIELDSVSSRLSELADALNRNCPSGVGVEGAYKLTHTELDQVCHQGAHWALKKGLASELDLICTEEGGCLHGADPAKVSLQAKKRGQAQLGTLGAGNHFVEVDVVDQIFDVAAAQAMGLQER